MDFYAFVLLVLLITGTAGTANALIRRRANNGKRSTDPDRFEDREATVDENQKLKNQMSGMESRIRVLERITTDSAGRISTEIENLR